MLPTENSDNHPKHIVCSISLCIFKEPVTVAPSGMVYEWEELENLIAYAKAQGKPALCPNTKMAITGYVKAFNILAAVEEYLQAHPDAVKDQYEKTKAETLPNTPIRINYAEHAPPHRVPEEPSADDRLAMEAAVNVEPRREDMNIDQLAVEPAPGTNEYVMVGFNLGPQEFSRRIWENLRLQREAYSRAEQVRVEAERVREHARALERERRERERQENERQERERQEQLDQVKLYGDDGWKRECLIEDIQDLIWALRFEAPPRQSAARNEPSLFSAMERLKTFTWKDIKVAEGPVNLIPMHEILRTAIRALKELHPELLRAAKIQFGGLYDCVKPWIGGEKSLSESNYALFAKSMGTVTGQPGYLISQILERVDAMLKTLCEKYPDKVKHAAVRPSI